MESIGDSSLGLGDLGTAWRATCELRGNSLYLFVVRCSSRDMFDADRRAKGRPERRMFVGWKTERRAVEAIPR